MSEDNKPKNLAFVEYTFLFDPGEAWTRVSDLEADLGAFFSSKDLEAEIVTPVGVTSKRIIFVTKKKEITPPALPPATRPQSPRTVINRMIRKIENGNNQN